MEDNTNNKSTEYKVVDISGNENKKKKGNFGKSILLPFCSGILGTTLVIGTCLVFLK